MKSKPILVIGISGYTKVQKSGLARLLNHYYGFRIYEMSQPIRDMLKSEKRMDVYKIVELINKKRKEYGPKVLAILIEEKILKDRPEAAVIVGVRSYEDHLHFKEVFPEYQSVFVHTLTKIRHERMSGDKTSIARTDDDFKFLDDVSYLQGIRHVAQDSEHILVNEGGFPLTALEQLFLILLRISGKKSFENNEFIQKKIKVLSKTQLSMEHGFTKKQLPVYQNEIPISGEDISRVIKPKGELATISNSCMNFIAYVNFPKDGMPKANHYHCEKIEYLYLIKGVIKLYIRRGGRPEEFIKEEIINEGELLCISPGWAHAYITIEDGFAIEFSPTNFDIVKRDKVRDFVIPE